MTSPPPHAAAASEAALAQALGRTADLAAEGMDSPEAALESAVELACELTGWPLGHVVLPLPEGPRRGESEEDAGSPDPGFQDTNIWHLSAAGERSERGAALVGALEGFGAGALPGGVGPSAPTAAGRAFHRGEPAWVELAETRADAGSARAALGDAGLRSAFAVPILVRGAVAAVCEFFTPDPAPRGGASNTAEGAAAIAVAIGRQVAGALTLSRTRAQLAAREDDLFDLFETAAAGIVLLEPNGVIRRCNRAFAQSLGRSPKSLAGRPISDLFAPGGRGGGPLLAAARSGRALLGHEADFLVAPDSKRTSNARRASDSRRANEGNGSSRGEIRTLLIDADARLPPAPPGPGEAPNRPASAEIAAADDAAADDDERRQGGMGPEGGLFVGPALRCFTRDVTARRRRDQDRNRLAEIVRATPDAVTSKNLAGVLQTWNEGAVRMYGHSPERALGRTAPELGIVPRERREEDARLMATAAAGKRVEQFQTKRVRADGTRIDVSLTVGPVRDAAGRVVGAAFVARDITEQKRAAEQLERATSRAEQASRAKTEFLANVSHELRTPMSAILGFTELAADEALPPHVLDWLDTVRESADHLLALLNEILDFSRIESRRFELDPIPFSPREVVEETVRSLAPIADRKGLELTGSVARGVPDALTGDPVRLRQILTNLTGNAVKFTDRGRVAVRIERETSGGDAGNDAAGPDPQPGDPVRLHLTVQDTGPGIAAADRERVFQPFAQADNTATRKHGGTGLGLSITHRLIGLMGGAVWMESLSESDLPQAESRTGESRTGESDTDETNDAPPDDAPATGTTFHVTLTLPAADPASVSMEGTAADVPKDLVPKLRGLPVLVVDASPENRRLLCEALESWQMSPVSASTEQEARDMVAAAAADGHAFPLVLADAALAGLPKAGSGKSSTVNGAPQGGVVAEAAAAGGAGVVLVTADGRRRRRAELDAPGVAGAVEKPIARSELLDTIVAALGAEPIHDSDGDRPRSVIPAAQAARLRVLLVEDTAANRKVLTAVLAKRGHKVTVAVNGRAGVETFTRALDRAADRAAAGKSPVRKNAVGGRGGGFDAVLMDVQMPVLDGLRATAELRRIEEARGLPRTPVLALTAHALKGDRERCLQAGMDGYLSKPINVHELIGALERHARRARRTAPSRERAERLAASPVVDPRHPTSVTLPALPGKLEEEDLPETEFDMPVMDDDDLAETLPAEDAPAESRSAPVIDRDEDGLALFDRSAALARMGGDSGLLAEVAGLFAEDAPPLCRTFDQAARSGNAEAARVAAHTLKGICATLGGERAKAAAAAAEAAASAHVDDALMRGRDPSSLPADRVADLPPAGDAMTAAVQRLAAALTEAFLTR
ncbi:PAS domain-containing hybrid sensor histidine kinase/response regulator [Alienimonas chondri]|uniref:histidine kinase n=1 Tax=Alienimonas chondri TaxID=2681879 RepID=A0ABX1VIU0_9PLAN|nr:PAS domain S-box protein [Alienimonas chondri]NNJ27455.1 Sensor histidine kinase RcsC [Alienimonas chondri]